MCPPACVDPSLEPSALPVQPVVVVEPRKQRGHWARDALREGARKI